MRWLDKPMDLPELVRLSLDVEPNLTAWIAYSHSIGFPDQAKNFPAFTGVSIEPPPREQSEADAMITLEDTEWAAFVKGLPQPVRARS